MLSISLVKKESTNVLKVKIEILERAPLFNSTFCLAPNRATGKSADLLKESGGQGWSKATFRFLVKKNNITVLVNSLKQNFHMFALSLKLLEKDLYVKGNIKLICQPTAIYGLLWVRVLVP